jgi:hypothetical protein
MTLRIRRWEWDSNLKAVVRGLSLFHFLINSILSKNA